MATFYVSTEGNDSWSGKYSEPLPDGSDGPLATLEQAQVAMAASSGADTTYVREGTYTLSAPLSLTSADSNSTYAAFGGETVTLSGGAAVSGWTQGADGVWMAEVVGGDVEQLVVDGVAQTEARYPNYEADNPIRGGWLWADDLPSGYDPTKALAFDPADFAPGQLAPGMTVTVFDDSGYSSEVLTIASVNYAAGVMTFVESSEYELGTTSRYFVSGAEVLLDQPGEWWYDDATHTLYYKAPAGFDGTGAVVSDEQTLIDIANAHNVTIEGFGFSDTTASNDDTLEAAVRVTNSSGVIITGNSFTNVGKGVYLDDGSYNDTVSDNEFSHIWSKAVELGPETHENLITNNVISHSGEVFRTSGAISLQETWGNTISHNLIQDVPRFGIQEVNWDPDQKSGGNIIEYNEILRSGQETPDVGAIYTVANLDPNHLGDVIRYNEIVDTGGLTATDNGFVAGNDFSSGIYLDDFASNAEIYGNFISGTSFAGILLHGGDNIDVYNNIIVDGDFTQVQLLELDGRSMTGIDVHDNIIQNSNSDENTVDLDPDYVDPSSVHDNIYYSPSGALPQIADTTFTLWQLLGGDLGSIVSANPGFTSPQTGDFSLKAGSLAAQLGFIDLPWDDIGASQGATPIMGGPGNDVLVGTTRDDDMQGGNGNDTYVVDNAGDKVVESSGGGTDLVQASVTFTLAANVEKLTLTGSSAINGTGNSTANVLTGNSANNVLTGNDGSDTLKGLGGHDKMVGGNGDDTYVVDSSGDVVVEKSNGGTDTVQSSVSFTLAGNLNNLTLTGSSAINGTGNSTANVLTGNSANNVLTGNDGNDTLNGLGGHDKMVGGAGDDAYVVDSSGDVVRERSNGGTDTVQASVSYTLGDNVNKLTLTGSSAISGTGNALGNTLTGNTAKNTLDGDAGSDKLIGGGGNDRLIGEADADTFVFHDGDGRDTVTDFENGVDTLDLRGVADVHDRSDLHLTDTGADVLVDYGTGSFLVEGVAGTSLLDPDDFIFA